MKQTMVALAGMGDVIDALPEVEAHLVNLLRLSDELLVGAGDRADASFHAFRHELSQDIKQEIGKFQALGGSPIGSIDLFLDSGAMELAVREAVDGENVAIFAVQPSAEGGQGLGLAERLGGFGAEPQSDGIGLMAGHSVTDGQGVMLQGVKGFLPGLASVNIGAISQVLVVRQFHALEARAKDDWMVR